MFGQVSVDKEISRMYPQQQMVREPEPSQQKRIVFAVSDGKSCRHKYTSRR